MALWSPDDPYGVAILRNVLLAFTMFLVVFGGYRSIVRGDAYEYFLVASAIALGVGLFLETAIRALRRDPP